MDINMEILPFVIEVCLVLHNVCNIHKETLIKQHIFTAVLFNSRDTETFNLVKLLFATVYFSK